MTADYLADRQNVVGAPMEELNRKLAAIVDAFDLNWLASQGSHPLQRLWARGDVLATNELLNFGDAVERLGAENADWLRGQVEKVKTGDAGERAGAVFEILGLNLFSRDDCKVVPAPRSKPGFDGTLVLPDGSRILVSIKNHGMSSREDAFLRNAQALDAQLQSGMQSLGLNGLEVNVIAHRHLDEAAFKSLGHDVATCLSEVFEPHPGRVTDWPYTITIKSMEPQYGPLSSAALSSGLRVFSPPHANEQPNFNEAIRVGCENLLKQTKTETTDVCRLIMLRLSNTASMSQCKEWADWYFSEFPDDPIDVILLYQVAITTDVAADTSTVTHHLTAVTGPRFEAWSTGGLDGSRRRLPNLQVLVGTISAQQPRLVLISNGVEAADLTGWYMHQRLEAYKKVVFNGGPTEATLSNPAPGIMTHLVIEQVGQDPTIFKSRSDPTKALALLL